MRPYYLIPNFIANQTKKRKYNGTITGSVLFVDIGGFTSLTEKLLKKDNGAEELSEIINKVFSLMINFVYENNGFISTFAGDAFTAIFPNNVNNAFNSAKSILSLFNNPKGKIKKYKLSIKIGISYGEINWGIIRSKNKYVYYFKGNAINQASLCEHIAGRNQIVCDKEYKNHNSNIIIKKALKNYYLLDIEKINIKKNKSINFDIPIEILEKYYDRNVFMPISIGEFRNIESVFIQYRDFKNKNNFDKFIKNIIELSSIYKAYFNLMDFGDKGNVLFIIFGAPITYENDLTRTMSFALELKNKYGDLLKIGITKGKVFAGIIGNEIRATYTVLGDKVNTAARFMQRANWGDIYICENSGSEIQGKFGINYLGSVLLKGKDKEIPVYSLINKIRNINEFLYENQFVGRKNEIKQIKNIINENRNKKNSIIYITGPAGIGKSRLIFEAVKDYDKNVYTLKCDSVLRKSLNVFISFMESVFNVSENHSLSDNNKKFDKNFYYLKRDIHNIKLIKEFENIKSIYKSILKINKQKTFFEDLDPKGKYDNTKNAIIILFKILLSKSHKIFIIEDLQWMDNDSIKMFRMLFNQINEYSFTMIFSSRKMYIPFNNRIEYFLLKIDKFNKDSAKQLISNQLGYKIDKKLLDFILNKTENNPFYIEQFCRYLYEKNYMKLKHNILYLEKNITDIPDNINAILIARLDNLTKELKKAIQIASVLGNEFDVKILSKIIKEKSIDSILINGMNEDIWNAISRIKYIFKHALLKDAAYNMQLKKQLQKLHLLIAEIMEKEYRNNKKYYKDIAYHYENGRNKIKAKTYYVKAAEYAFSNYAVSESTELYKKAIKLTKNKLEKVQLQLKLTDTFEIIAQWDKSVKLLKKLLKIVQKEKFALEELKILRSLGYFLNRMAKRDDAEKYLFIAIKKYSKKKNKSFIIEIMACYNNLSSVYSRNGEYKKAERALKKSLLLEPDKKDMNTNILYAQIYNNLGLLYTNQRMFDKAIGYLKISIDIAKKINMKRIYSITNMANVYFYTKNYNMAIKYYKKEVKNAVRLQDHFLLRVLYNNLGSIYTILENYKRAIDYYNMAYEIGKKINDKNGIRVILTNIGSLYLYLGEYKKAFNNFDKALHIAEVMGDDLSVCKVLGQFCALYEQIGDYKNLKKIFDMGFSICNKKDWKEFSRLFSIYRAIYYYKKGNIKESKKNYKIIEKLQDIKMDEEILLKEKILKLKIFNELNEDNLLQLLKLFKTKYNLLNIYIELYNITKNKKYSNKVIQFAHKIFKKTDSIYYRNILNKYERL